MIHVGMSYRPEMPEFIEDACKTGLISMLEIIPDSYAFEALGRKKLATALNKLGLPYCFHHVGFSPGSADFKKDTVFKKRASISSEFAPRWISEHLTIQRAGPYNFDMNLNLPRTPQTIDLLVRNLDWIRRETNRPLIVENIPIRWEYRESTVSHSNFVSTIAERLDCGILLDIHNLYTDHKNYGFDPISFMNELDPKRIVEIHVAGGTPYKSIHSDGHCNNLEDGDFALLEYAVKRFKPTLVLLEREVNFTDFEGMRRDLRKIWRICEKSRTYGKPRRTSCASSLA